MREATTQEIAGKTYTYHGLPPTKSLRVLKFAGGLLAAGAADIGTLAKAAKDGEADLGDLPQKLVSALDLDEAEPIIELLASVTTVENTGKLGGKVDAHFDSAFTLLEWLGFAFRAELGPFFRDAMARTPNLVAAVQA